QEREDVVGHIPFPADLQPPAHAAGGGEHHEVRGGGEQPVGRLAHHAVVGEGDRPDRRGVQNGGPTSLEEGDLLGGTAGGGHGDGASVQRPGGVWRRSEEHTSEL